MLRRQLIALSPGLLAAGVGVSPTSAQALAPAEARAIAKEAYIYAFAMLENYQTLYRQAVDEDAPEYVGGFGRYRHYSEPFLPENHDVVTPNNDTPYSWAWLDLRAEPWVLSVPAVPRDRYYVTQWVDLFTYNFAYVGVRATGFEAGSYLFAGPTWSGETPAGIKAVFRAETELVGTLTRTALHGREDVPDVKALQAQYRLEPLSQFLGTTTPPPLPEISFPVYARARTQTHDFIGYLNFLLQLAMPPHPSEVVLRERFATIGIVPGQPWDATRIEPTLLTAVDAGVAEAQAALSAELARTFDSNGLFGSREFQKNNYLRRAVAAAKGLYGNSVEEAWYGGIVGDGGTASVMRFPAGGLPPADFFWSLTLYTLPDRFLYANPLDRYSIGDRTKGFIYGPDGSLAVYLGHTSPGADREANWLPAPAGKYSLVARVYGPKPSLMEKKWSLPKPEPVN